MAEEFLTSREIYEQEAKKHTEEHAGKSLDDMEKVDLQDCFQSWLWNSVRIYLIIFVVFIPVFFLKKLIDPVPQFVPQHLLCPLTKKMFVDPVKTVYGTVYERKAIEEHLKQ